MSSLPSFSDIFGCEISFENKNNINLPKKFHDSKMASIDLEEDDIIVIEEDGTKEYEIPMELKDKLYPHQKIGVQFMLNRVLAEPPKGCVIADAMGMFFITFNLL